MKLKRFELHQTYVGASMRERPDGEWVMSDDVEKLEAELIRHKATLQHIKGLVEDGSLNDEDVLQKIVEICNGI